MNNLPRYLFEQADQNSGQPIQAWHRAGLDERVDFCSELFWQLFLDKVEDNFHCLPGLCFRKSGFLHNEFHYFIPIDLLIDSWCDL